MKGREPGATRALVFLALVYDEPMRLVALPLIASLLWPQAVLAQDLPPIPPGADKISPLHKGDAAPYDGQLFDQLTALRWANWLQMYKLRLKADLELADKVCTADIELRDKKLAFEQEKYKTVVTALEKRVAAAEDPPFYRTASFGFGMGVLSTVVVVVATAALVNAVSTK